MRIWIPLVLGVFVCNGASIPITSRNTHCFAWQFNLMKAARKPASSTISEAAEWKRASNVCENNAAHMFISANNASVSLESTCIYSDTYLCDLYKCRSFMVYSNCIWFQLPSDITQAVRRIRGNVLDIFRLRNPPNLIFFQLKSRKSHSRS